MAVLIRGLDRDKPCPYALASRGIKPRLREGVFLSGSPSGMFDLQAYLPSNASILSFNASFSAFNSLIASIRTADSRFIIFIISQPKIKSQLQQYKFNSNSIKWEIGSLTSEI